MTNTKNRLKTLFYSPACRAEEREKTAKNLNGLIGGQYKALKKNYDVILFACGVIAAMAVRYLCRNYKSGDFIIYLEPWVDFYRNNGGWHGLKEGIGNYNVLYQYILIVISYFNINCLYLIKLVSILFDVILAFGCTSCLKILGADKRKRRLCFLCILLLPTVFINSAFWAQCDSIYVAFIVWSVYFLLSGKNARSISFLAIAFSFKLQTVFIMPLFLIAFLNRQLQFRQLLMFPVVFFAVYIPALIFGKPLSELLYIYVGQTTEYPFIVMNAPTALSLLRVNTSNQAVGRIFVVLAGIFALAAVALACKKKLYPEQTLKLALLFSIGIPFLLPYMHDRYFYTAEILSVICVFAYGKKFIPVMAATELASLACYMQHFGFINQYAGKIMSYVCSNSAAAVLMMLALVLTLLYFHPTAGAKYYTVGISAAMISTAIIISAASGYGTNVTIDGKLINFIGVSPYREQTVFMIPLRAFINAWGGTVSYDDETGQIKMQRDSTIIELDTDSNTALRNGQTLEIERLCVLNDISYLSHNDITNLTGLHCRAGKNTVAFSDALSG